MLRTLDAALIDLVPFSSFFHIFQTVSPGHQLAAGVFSSTEEARQCWNSLEQAELRKSRLQAELRSLQSQQRQHQTRATAATGRTVRGKIVVLP